MINWRGSGKNRPSLNLRQYPSTGWKEENQIKPVRIIIFWAEILNPGSPEYKQEFVPTQW
jgi:hypothetical protein